MDRGESNGEVVGIELAKILSIESNAHLGAQLNVAISPSVRYPSR